MSAKHVLIWRMYDGRMGLNGSFCFFSFSFLHGWRSHFRANHLADTMMQRRDYFFFREWHAFHIRAADLLTVFTEH